MHTFIYMAIGIAVAALIGGVTNHLAIKMLFHPRTVWKVGGKRVPFTPGIIPKRKEEIAQSLGHVVAEYLVTSHGLSGLLQKPEFQSKLTASAIDLLDRWAQDESTVAELILKYHTGGQALDLKNGVIRLLRTVTLEGANRLWQEEGWKDKTLKGLIPGWGDELKAAWSAKAADFLLEELTTQLSSPSGQVLVGTVVRQFLQNAGGFFGALAGMFMDEQKIIVKVQAALIDGLRTPSARNSFRNLIAGRLTLWEEISLEDWGRRFSGGMNVPEWIQTTLDKHEPWKTWGERIWQLPVGQTLSRYRDPIAAALPSLISYALRMLERNMDRILSAVRLPELVEEQVKDFPVERLEYIILSVSGKEFRAITWLGALLGGIIGVVQSALMLWMP